MEGRGHAVGVGSESRQLDLPFDLHAIGVEVFFHEPLGFTLRNHQRVGMGCIGRVHADMGDQLRARNNVGGGDFETRANE
jgi:hypothetical protein